MNFYGIRELSGKTKTVLGTVEQNGAAVITDNGKPTAIILDVNEQTFDKMYEFVQRLRFQNAVDQLQKQSLNRFPGGMSEEEIEAEIAEARKG